MYEEYLSEYFLFLREKLEPSLYKTGTQLSRTEKEDLRSYLGEKYVDIVRRIHQGKTKPENPKQYVIKALDKSVLEYVVKEILHNRNRRCSLKSTDDLDRIPDTRMNATIPFYDYEILQCLNKLEKKVISLKANGYTHREVAYLLDISIDTSKKRCKTAKSKIQRLLYSEFR